MAVEPTDRKAYLGPERRSGKERRQAPDRREQIRFELEKPQRRSGRDRRKQQAWDGVLIR